MFAQIGAKAPNFKVSDWVQGLPTNIDKLIGNIIVIEVFQVNCPGCFLYGLPQAISIYEKYKIKKLKYLVLQLHLKITIKTLWKICNCYYQKER